MAWIDDGQDAVKPGATPEEFVVEGKPRSGTPVNARFSTAVTPENSYFEVDCINVSDGAFIGITTAASFKKGWGCKGLLFGRNLSSGGALVREGFGETVTSGSTVGVLTDFIGEEAARKVQVTFWQSGKCLGPAFLSTMTNPEAEVFPMVHTSKEGDKFAIRFGPVPDMESSGGAAAGPTDPRVGSWALTALRVGPELGQIDLEDKLGGVRALRHGVIVKISLGESPGEFQFAWRVVNNCGATAISSADDRLAPFDKLEPGKVMSTMMMGPEELMEVEQQLKEGFEGVHKWICDAGALLLNGPTIEMELAPAGADAGSVGSLPATEVDLV